MLLILKANIFVSKLWKSEITLDRVQNYLEKLLGFNNLALNLKKCNVTRYFFIKDLDKGTL